MFKMEKHARRQDSNLPYNRNIPGCFWNIFQAIDHHPWHNVKKMLPYRKHSRSKGGSKSTPYSHHGTEVPEQMNDNNTPQFCTAQSCPYNRRSGAAQVSEVMTKETSEEESIEDWKLSSNSQRRLSRTHSIHHFESSCCSPEGSTGSSRVSPQPKSGMKLVANGLKSNSLNAMDIDYFVQRKIDMKLTSCTEKCNEEVKKSKEDDDGEEVFKENRIIFAELLQGSFDSHTPRTPKNMKSSASLAKSRSFPAPGLARKGFKKLSSLQHKLTESFPKGKRSAPQPSKMVESDSSMNEDVTPCDSNSSSSHRQQPSSFSLGSNRGLKYVGWNQLVIKRFNFIRKKIRHSIKDRKKGNNQKPGKRTPTTDRSRHELHDRNEARERSEMTASEDGLGFRGYSEAASSESDNLDKEVQTKTGTASLERCSQLSDYGFNRNREEKFNKIPIRETPVKSFGRNLSMPDINLFYTLFTEPPHGVSRPGKPKRGVVHFSNNVRRDENPAHRLNVEISQPLPGASSVLEQGDDNIAVDHLGSVNEVENDETAELRKQMPCLDVSDSKCHLLEIQDVDEAADEQEQEQELFDLEGCIVNELEPSNDQFTEASVEALPPFETVVNHEIIDDTEKISLSFLLHSEPDRINNGDFDYMRYILQLTSLIETDHAINRPLGSSMFEGGGEEAHSYKIFELERSWEKVDQDSDHQLMIDLVYETLHNVFEKSFICFLKTFSSKSQLRPMPLGLYVLEEVREKVAWYLCLGPELDQFLDDVVERDLRKGDDWMNLESESEYVALELEDLILDDLLDEVLRLSTAYRARSYFL
ncbi:uncharacterized protein LOC111781954 isoform X1 [Cucurbita pepo subsp. pepo]|uniref:uncharacterized protein LOC111781954 isoform X1 n=2 Tax=Cucurbita pepo subsp. pepo TaxID=3664 RepID=UPI000C9D77C0|nr:uncharacterized protein LOC111781954 isoform X1 [Cucurbita pepo subsp. pepo]XP_023518467.1 uncharacterized protein LOC111781954 isoform X1 [Cucurbita pepo subsp. pepo]